LNFVNHGAMPKKSMKYLRTVESFIKKG
jgi:hypothetical protein